MAPIVPSAAGLYALPLGCILFKKREKGVLFKQNRQNNNDTN